MENQNPIRYGVYGTLREGCGNHRLLENSTYLGTILSPPMFTMKHLGGFPALIPGETRIVMEVYEVDKPTERNLWRLEGYSPNGRHNLYDITKIKTKFGTISVFTMSEKACEDSPIIHSGDWLKQTQHGTK